MTKYWVAVACREHVLRGISLGICQVCHGKKGPLASMKGNDWIIYYSPTLRFGEKIACQKFTACGLLQNNEAYQVQMSENFTPWRKDVCYFEADEVPILPLLDTLTFIKDKKRWGYPFRLGLFEIPFSDFSQIASHMGIAL